MAKPKRLTTGQLRSAAKYLVATNQLSELMACVALERVAEYTKEMWQNDPDVRSDECYTYMDFLVENAQSVAYEDWFHYSQFGSEIEDHIETLAWLYRKHRPLEYPPR